MIRATLHKRLSMNVMARHHERSIDPRHGGMRTTSEETEA